MELQMICALRRANRGFGMEKCPIQAFGPSELHMTCMVARPGGRRLTERA
jgi:hypothetical protein